MPQLSSSDPPEAIAQQASAMGPSTVMIVEDDPATRQRLARVIREHSKLRLVAAVGTCAEARAALRGGLPQVCLVDIGLPDGNGIELIREVTSLGKGVDVMVITVFGDEEHVLSALKAGATGYVLKDCSPQDIGDAVVELVRGGSPISPPIARYLLKRFRGTDQAAAEPAVLTTRELEVLNLIAKGFSYREIADLLAISPQTMPGHIKSIYRKLAVHSRSEAVFEAVQTGLVDLGGHSGPRSRARSSA
jgi:DNA-binding NarL/FixJ family response regulator